MSRNTSPRKQIGEHQVGKFRYPFSSCCLVEETEEGDCPIEIRHIPHRISRPIGSFSKNIKRWIWSRPGEKDEESWVCIVELKPEPVYEGVRYVYFTAWCDFTGFDCQGGSHAICTSNVEDLIEFALTESEYKEYMETTEEADAW
jgi:hypothetical protein